MWLPRWDRIFGPVVIRKHHDTQQAQLEKIVQQFKLNTFYHKWEIEYDLKKRGVHNVKAFFTALLHYGYLEHDIHTDFYQFVREQLAKDKFKQLHQKTKKHWWRT